MRKYMSKRKSARVFKKAANNGKPNPVLNSLVRGGKRI